jgi:hypothetical protein
MLEERDIQAISVLLDEKLKENNKTLKDEIISEIGENIKENNKTLKDEIISEIGETIGEAFSNIEAKIDRLEEEIAKRPTRNEVFGWADRRIIDLEIGKERHDYLHIDELDKLPSPAEINRTLIERGFKQKLS